jgi:hypothetical protein
VFCKGTPVTGEHAWPRWTAKHLPREKAEHLRVVESAAGLSVEQRGFRPAATTEARCVCRSCNQGWMHELETAAETELTPMIEGKPQRLHEWRQAVAATWALKTAMMVEHCDTPDTRTIPLEIYPMFRWFLRPTTMTQVWMAHYVGESPHVFGHGMLRAQVIGPSGTIDPDDAKPYALVLSVGQLAFWIIGHLVQGAAPFRPHAEVAARIVPVWPVVPAAAWPPPESVGDDQLHGLVLSLATNRP